MPLKNRYTNPFYKVPLLKINTINIRKNKAIISLLCVVFSTGVTAQKPLANFTGSPLAGCSPLIVNFQDLSTNSPTSLSWDLGNGSTSTSSTPTAIYVTPGPYTVKLIAKNASGSDTLTRLNYITVYSIPSLNFSADDSLGCFPLPVQFTDLSTPGAGTVNTTWEWNFGDGATSTDRNPAHTFTASGNFTVILKVTNDKGCSKIFSKPSYIKVSPGVVADFTTSLSNICSPPVTANFTNTSTGPGTLSYSWNFGDGQTSTLRDPSNTYNSAGSFNVTLTVTSSIGCDATKIKNSEVVIGSNSTSFSSPDSALTNTPINFTNTSAPLPVSQNWNFGDVTSSTDQNPVKTYNTPGTYFVILTNNYGSCTFTAVRTIVITPKSLTSFTASDSLSCKPPLSVNFQNTTPGAVSWLWDFGDSSATSTLQNPSHTYTKYGNFNVTLITKNSAGKADTLVKINFIRINRAVIDISGIPSGGGCVPLTINPVPNITTVGTVTSYLWNFGDGGISTLQNPSYTYITQGVYSVSLIVTTSLGCTDTLTLASAVKAGTLPTADFSATPLTTCVFTKVQFTNLSSATVNDWLWDFGDGATSTDPNPQHEFALPGTNTISLTVKYNGCPAKIVKINYITVLPPVSQFTTTPNCDKRTEFTFTDKSIGPLIWFWDFGDGTFSPLQNPPPHNFPGLGVYTVSLTVTNGTCSHTSIQTIRAINENPNFTSDVTTLCRGTDVLFTATDIIAANINSYLWNFGDGVQASTNNTNIIHTYPASGTTTVTLITTDLNSCYDTISKPTYIRTNGPVANFSATNTGGCKGLTTTFNDLSASDGINPITGWQWKYGDGAVQSFTAPPFTHTYTTVGTFSVSLKVTDAVGCSDSLTINDLINSTDPSVSFDSPDSLTCPGAITNWNVNTVGTGFSYSWQFGDGAISTDINPPKSFAAPGQYSVKLVVTDLYGCPDSLTRINYIKVDVPMAAFTIDDSASFCTPFEVNFTNTSAYYNSQLWTFEPGVTSTVQNPAYYFTTPGLFNTELVVTSPGGCTDTAYRTIQLYDTAGSSITYTPLNGCKPRSVSFNTNISGPATYIWDFGDGQSLVTDSTAITHLYNQFGSFVPKVILKDNTGCLTPITGFDTIQMVGATTKFGLDKPFLCDAGLINFIDSTTFNDPITNYYWDFGDGNTSTLQNPSHLYSGAGLYNVTLAVKTAQGCVDTTRMNNALKIVSGPDISIDGDTAMCIYAPLQFFGKLNVTDTSAVAWNWDFGNGVTSTLQNPALQTYSTSGNFISMLITTNSSGCKDTVTRNIRIHPLPTVSMPPDLTTNAGSTITIPANYSGNMTNYLWSPPAFLSCTTCPQPSVTPDYNMLYTIIFSDSNNCRNSGTILIKTLCKNANLFVPNTFSPNDDGSNDVFYPRGTGLDRAKFLRIFNRWGEVVFERYDFPVNNAANGWDGTWKGKKANAGVYIYQLDVYCKNGELISSTGNVALIR